MSIDKDKLAKLLALAASPMEQEALSALRMANTMLGTAGMSFSDIAGMIRTDLNPAGRDVRTSTPSIVARAVTALLDPSFTHSPERDRILRRLDTAIDIGSVFASGLVLGTLVMLIIRHW